MLKYLSTVEDAFDIAGRGVVVVPGIPEIGEWHIRIGDIVTLERPDGTRIESTLRGMESIRRPNSVFTPLLLGTEITKTEVPVGTTLWVNQSQEAISK